MRIQYGLAALLLAGAACGVSKDEFAAAQRDAADAKKQYQAETEKTAALEKDLASQKETVAAQEQKIAELEASSAQLAQEKGQLEAKSKQYEQLSSSLQQQIESGQVEISELRGKMTVKLKDKVLFASGSTRLGQEGQRALDAVADALKGLSGKTIIVGGYTDNVPTGAKLGFKDNWDLSGARATTVVRYLQSKGVPPAMLAATGFSEFRPLAPNDSVQGRSQNRRIEIAVAADPEAEQKPVEPAPAEAPEASK